MKSNSTSILRAAKIVVYVLVLAGIVYTVWNGVSKISESEVSLSKFRWSWLPVASAFYLLSMLICAVYWHTILLDLGQQPDLRDSLRAFILGQLGKYFPGKALVVIVRTSLISGPKVQTAVAATSVFLETLTYMAVGAGVASLMMIFFVDVGFWLLLFGIGAIMAAGLPIVPSVFRLLIKVLRIDRLSPKIGSAVAKLDSRTAIRGWLILPFSWILVGLSLWATIQVIGVGHVSVMEVPRLTACAGLAVVVGFLSMVPGGLGVREFVLIAILAPIDPAFDASSTLVVAVVLRLVWLMTETLLTIILKVMGLGSRLKSESVESPSNDEASSNSDPTPAE